MRLRVYYSSTVGIDASQKIFLQAHGIKTVVNLIIACEEFLATFSCKPVTTITDRSNKEYYYKLLYGALDKMEA